MTLPKFVNFDLFYFGGKRHHSLRFVMIEVKRFAINFSVRRLLNFLVFACLAHLAEEQRQRQTKTFLAIFTLLIFLSFLRTGR